MSKPSRKELEAARRMALKNLAKIMPEEDAAITADALSDRDNPPADDLFRRRGRPRSEVPKEAVKPRLDPDVLAYFRATGAGWQTRMNEALCKAAGFEGVSKARRRQFDARRIRSAPHKRTRFSRSWPRSGVASASARAPLPQRADHSRDEFGDPSGGSAPPHCRSR